MLKSLHSKDVRLPPQLQRAMAAEAEASREARAKARGFPFSWTLLPSFCIIPSSDTAISPLSLSLSVGHCGWGRAECVQGFEGGCRGHPPIPDCPAAPLPADSEFHCWREGFNHCLPHSYGYNVRNGRMVAGIGCLALSFPFRFTLLGLRWQECINSMCLPLSLLVLALLVLLH